MMLEYYALPHARNYPTRANPSDAGLDLPFNPIDFQPITILPGESKLFSTGLKFGIPHGFMMQIMNRSSMAAKRHLIVGACVVDSGYDGEVFVNLHNIGTEPQTINPGDKIAQGVVIQIAPVRFVAACDDTINSWYPITISNRGAGALGSTGQ
jgi:dUTP pyrophosphatase